MDAMKAIYDDAITYALNETGAGGLKFLAMWMAHDWEGIRQHFPEYDCTKAESYFSLNITGVPLKIMRFLKEEKLVIGYIDTQKSHDLDSLARQQLAESWQILKTEGLLTDEFKLTEKGFRFLYTELDG